MSDDEEDEIEGKNAPRKELKRLIYEARKSRRKEKGHFQLVDSRGYCVKYLKITPKTVSQLPVLPTPQAPPKKKKKTSKEQLDNINQYINEIRDHALKEDQLRLLRLLNSNGTKFSDINRAKEIEKAGLAIPPKLSEFIDKKLNRMKKRRERISSLPLKLIVSNRRIEDKPIQKPLILPPVQTVKLPIKQINYESVIINRDNKIEKDRVKLPSVLMESEIIDSILNNHVTIITGDTGCGKSTQIPQFLYENGFCHEGTIIGVTQPRRVACTAISNQVKLELGDDSLVGFHIRNLKSNAKNCKIKFMTEGILLQEIRNDLLCSKYSVIIIDEAHERSLNCDILIGLLSRVIITRWKRFESNGSLPLKLVIMSATINVNQFTESNIFNNLTVNHVHISTLKQSPVSIHYLKKTNENYLEEAKKAVLKIHSKFPRGSILVFVCGKDEIKSLTRSLSELDLYSPLDNDSPIDDSNNPSTDDSELSNTWKGSDGSGTLKIVPLHASQASHEQNIAFIDPNDGERVVIISTNVAETSITLPNIRYVVDCGKEKRKSYTCGSTISKFVIGDISQSSADQRAGRAGRLGPGHCYRMYSSSVYDHIFKPYSQPEIDVCPLDGTLLFLCSLGIVHLDTFPFLTPPTIDNINRSLKTLADLEAITIDGNKVNITMLGKAMSEIPIEPRYSKMILISMSKQINNLVWYTCLITSSLSLGLLIDNTKHMDFNNDMQMYLELCIQFNNLDLDKRYSWCIESGINYKSIISIIDLAKLLLEVCNTRFNNEDKFETCNEKPNPSQLNLLYEIILTGLVDHIALLESDADKLYNTLMDGIQAKIHGNSKCSNNKHKLITYNSISENNGHFLNGILPIDKEMIARVDSLLVETIGEPQAIPPPLYIPEADSVIGYVNRVYKPTSLNLGVIRYPIKGEVAIKCFGKALVSGKVYQNINNPDIFDDVIQYLVKFNCNNKWHLEEILNTNKGNDANKLKELLNF